MKEYEKPTLETIVLTGDVIATSGDPEDCKIPIDVCKVCNTGQLDVCKSF